MKMTNVSSGAYRGIVAFCVSIATENKNINNLVHMSGWRGREALGARLFF